MKEREFERGDRVQFTRNDRETGRMNWLTGNVTAIDAEQRAMTVRDARGQEHQLSLDQTRKPPRDDGGCQKHLCRDQSSPP